MKEQTRQPAGQGRPAGPAGWLRRNALPLTALALSALCCLLFMHRHVNQWLDADDASEMVLARLLAQEGGIISPNWHYSTELRVLGHQVVLSLLFRLFSSWHTVRILGLAVLMCLLTASFLYFSHQAGLGRWGIWAAAALWLPLSRTYVHFVFRHFGYISFLAYMFLTLGMVFQLDRSAPGGQRRLLYGVLAVFSFAVGLGGVRELLELYLPLVGALLLPFLAEHRAELQRDGSLPGLARALLGQPAFCGSLLALAGAAAGAVCNQKLLHRYLSFGSFESVRYQATDWQTFHWFFEDLPKLFGFVVEEPVFSLATLGNLSSVALCGLSFWAAAHILRRHRQFCRPAVWTAAFFFVSLGMHLFLFATTDMYYTARYNMLELLLYLPILAFCGQKLQKHMPKLAKTAGIAVAVMLLMVSAVQYSTHQNRNDNTDIQDIACWLQQNEYQYGYATFWNCNILTELSNGQIGVQPIGDSGRPQPESIRALLPYKWLVQCHAEDYRHPDKVFVLLSRDEYALVADAPLFSEDRMLYLNGRYVVFGYNNTQGLYSLVQ